MNDLLAIITLMFWPLIPLFWIPVHSGVHFFRRIGLAAYFLPMLTWLHLTVFIYKNSAFLLRAKITCPAFCSIVGWILLIAGTFLHVWTARLLGLWGIIGVTEISGRGKETLAAEGPFSIVRHPTYLAHTLMFSGVFLITGTLTVGIVALLDFIIVNTVIIPLEEKELADRFGEQYIFYKKKVPSRFFPSFSKR